MSMTRYKEICKMFTQSESNIDVSPRWRGGGAGSWWSVSVGMLHIPVGVQQSPQQN